MIGLILLILSLLVLKVLKHDFSVLGFNQPKIRSIEFTLGLLISIATVSVQMFSLALMTGFEWTVNPGLASKQILEGVRFVINSVLFEEFIFRGVLLFLAIHYLGKWRGCLLSALAFGIYHWFSYELFGQWGNMLYVLLLTGSFGLMLAYAYAQTRSLILPIALHLGWNLATIVIFSNGPIGAQWLVPNTEVSSIESAWFSMVYAIVIPISMVILVMAVLRCYGKNQGE